MKTAIKICLWLLALTPLIVDPNVFFPYTSGKNLLIETCLVLAGILILVNFFYSREYREEIIGKTTKYIKHPLVLSVIAFIFISIISTIFAVDKYAAFWGEISRAEGLAGMMFFFSFFVLVLLTFERKDWLLFFKLSLFASLILIGKESIDFFNGVIRPGSFTGNPTFLAGYLLFSITSALVIISEVKNISWKYFSVLIIILSIVGIFMAQTRGTILGLGLGIIVTLIYSAFKGKDINYKIFNLRKVALIFIVIGVVFSGVFVSTRKNEIWQKVPGLSRLAVVGSGDTEDISTPVRLYLYQTAIKSVDPVQNGFKKLLLGWGPDNYTLADSKYYNPELYKYEVEWHDRAHNKLLDVLVMTGIIGLLAYLAIWFAFFKFLFRKSAPRSFSEVGLLVFAIAYLTHLMFVFDQISTSIPFFVILAFTAYLTPVNAIEESKKGIISSEIKERGEILTVTFLVILTMFLAFVYLKSTLPGYIQMRNYTSIIKSQNPITIDREIDSVLTPFTLAQMNMRRNFMEVTDSLYKKNPNDFNFQLIKKSINIAEEYIVERPTDFGFMTTLADFYNHKVVFSTDVGFLKRGEELFNTILSYSPNRPDINRGLAANLFYQRRFLESFILFEKTFDSNPDYFSKDKSTVEGIYTKFIQYFYEQKDKENFTKVADRLKANNYDAVASLDKILNYLDKNGVWPNVAFE